MLPDNFDFALLPEGSSEFTLKEIGMYSSTIEDIDYTITSWLKKDLNLFCNTNEGRVQVPVLWQVPERAYQIKNEKNLRDENNTLKLPLISIERTNIVKNPEQKGSFQAHTFSVDKNGRSGRFVIAKQIVPDKTQNFAIASGTRTNTRGKRQQFFPGNNKKIVIRTLSVPIPVYVNVQYKIKLKTEYQQSMNELLTPFIARTGQINAFVLNRNGHIYEVFIDQNFTHNNNLSNLNEDLREFNTEISIRVLGYLIGEGPNDDRPIVRVDENTVEYIFPTETTLPSGLIDF
tara:strand:+ start:5159 stop:6025 length:867 start_codon:yes stop_codon:yes gene_type:complete